MNKKGKMLSKSNEIRAQIMFDEDSNIFPTQNPANQPSMSPLSCCPRKNLRGMPRPREKNTEKQEDDSKCHPCHQVCPDVFYDITPTKRATIRTWIRIKTLKMLESNYLPLIHTADGRNLAPVNNLSQFQGKITSQVQDFFPQHSWWQVPPPPNTNISTNPGMRAQKRLQQFGLYKKI